MAAEPISPVFSWWARELAGACRSLGLVAPGFSSPPAAPDADRTLRRWPGGEGATVYVRLWSRPLTDIREDMIAGVLAANRASGDRADELRARLEEVVPIPDGQAA